MAKDEFSDSQHEESSENSSSEEEPDTPSVVSNYEKKRLSRIAENRARMAALGLPKMASSFMGSSQKVKKQQGKGKKVKGDDEDEYRPDEDEDDDDDDDEDFADEDFVGTKRKMKNKCSRPEKKVPIEKLLSKSNYVDDDEELMQAISLSLRESVEALDAACGEHAQCSDKNAMKGSKSETKGNSYEQDDTGRKKKKKTLTKREEMTEDEVVIHFCQLDEAGKGNITLRDIRKMAMAHDFTWTDKEMADMIYFFDSDGDGKLSLEDFQKIVARCNMVQGFEKS